MSTVAVDAVAIVDTNVGDGNAENPRGGKLELAVRIVFAKVVEGLIADNAFDMEEWGKSLIFVACLPRSAECCNNPFKTQHPQKS